MCFNTSTWSSFFCKLHVYCHINSAFYSLLFTVRFECLPLCYPAEPECCICLLHNIQKKRRKYSILTLCVGVDIFVKVTPVTTQLGHYLTGQEQRNSQRGDWCTCAGTLGISRGRWAMAHLPLLIALVVVTSWGCSGRAGPRDQPHPQNCQFSSFLGLVLPSAAWKWWLCLAVALRSADVLVALQAATVKLGRGVQKKSHSK